MDALACRRQVKAISVKVGDKVRQGTLVLTLETAGAEAKTAALRRRRVQHLTPTSPAAGEEPPSQPAATKSSPPRGRGVGGEGGAGARRNLQGQCRRRMRKLVLGSGPAATAPRSAPADSA